MSKHSTLDIVLRDILQAVTPTQEDWAIRFAIINDLRSVVESMENLRGATVEPFGSFVSNLFSRWGDLDISIELSNGSHILSAAKKHKQTLLGDVLKALRMRGSMTNLQFIKNARIPILKCRSVRQSVSCDISINNLNGLMKSKILLWINKIDGRFHDLVLVVKEWARAHKINNSKVGTFNSYSLSLLVIFHLQTCVPAILPPLKDLYPSNMVDDLRGVRVEAENLIAETFDANINRFISDNSRPINRKSLPEIFVEFLRKFAQIDSWASELGICPYNGQWEQIKNTTRWLPQTYTLFVEDPFEQPQNTARSVSAGQLKRIGEAFLRTYSLLSEKYQNQNTLLSCLATPQVWKFVTRAPYPYPNHNGGFFHPPQHAQKTMPPHPRPPTHAHAQKTMPPHPRPPPHAHARVQSQHRIQNPDQATTSKNSTSRGPKQVHPGQQIWRQKDQSESR